MEELLKEFVERFRAAYGGDMLAVILYGSAASGEYHKKHSDLNLLCVLRSVGLTELERAREPLRWWLGRGQTAPLILSQDEVRGGSDVFPIEFLDIRESYRLLSGADLVAEIAVNTAHHRRQLEHELRSRLLRLRKRFIETQHDGKAVTALMLDSLPTFATLFRHALLLAGVAAPVNKHEIFRASAERFGAGPSPFAELLEIREERRKGPGDEAHAWFGAYLEGVGKVCAVVVKL